MLKNEAEIRALLAKAQIVPMMSAAEDYRQAVIDTLSWVLGETHGKTVADEFAAA